MKRTLSFAVALSLVTVLSLSVLVGTASATTYSGHVATWSPKGDAKVSGTTSITLHRSGHTYKFKASNEHTVFFDLGCGERVSRNTFFRDLAEDPSDKVLITWKWKHDQAGHHYRYASRVELTE
jgi:hypothetical protein